MHPAADDGELLGGDRLPRRAEDVRVLEGDVREDDDARRVEDVRRVVTAAEARLDGRCLHLPFAERDERRGGQRLELRRSDRLGRAADDAEQRPPGRPRRRPT